MNLQQVRGNGCILYFPPEIQGSDVPRGGKGYVVDLDAPLEAHWCRGQEWKLEPAPAGATPNLITNKSAQAALREHAMKAANAPAREPSQLAATVPPADDLEVRPRRGKVA